MRRFSQLTRRRQHARRTLGSSASPWRRVKKYLPNRDNRLWWIVGVAVALALTWICLPFYQRVPDDEATERLREIARKNTLPIYFLDLHGQTNAQDVFKYVMDVFALPGLTNAERRRAIEDYALVRLYLSESAKRGLFQHENEIRYVRDETLDILNQILSRGVALGGYGKGSLRAELAAYFDPKFTTEWESVGMMTIRILPEDRRIDVADTLSMEDAVLELERLVRTLPQDESRSKNERAALASLIEELARPFIVPNLFFNKSATREAQQANAAKVATIYKQRDVNSISVLAGTLALISLTILLTGLFLVSQIAVTPPSGRQWIAYGMSLLVGVLALRLGVWALSNPATHVAEWVGYPALLLPVATAAALSTILVGAPFGVLATVVLTVFAGLMVGVSAPTSFPQLLTLFGAGFVSSYTMKNIRSRRHLAMAGLYTTALATTIAFAATMIQSGALNLTMLRTVWSAFAAGFLTTAIVPAVLPAFESIAGTATDLELLDLSDLNHPLLLQMQKVAPGTFNHSLNVSRLAEAAAEVVEENSLLARVGAYYHDIGKMSYPHYFIENQEGGSNPHDRLTPTMSARVLTAHVKDGIELGRENRLPRAILDMIAQHHGSALIRGFYHKAAQQGDAVDESDFRYPGPKPQTKLAAIMLIADSIEAAANAKFKRASELSRRDCSTLVVEIVNHYVLDGQLDECDLTLNDLRLISQRFERSLLGMYHSRIDYPDEPKRRRADETELDTELETKSAIGRASA